MANDRAEKNGAYRKNRKITPKIEFVANVFISYSSKDEIIVATFAEELKNIGVDVWFDKWKILPGESITQATESGLSEERRILLLMLSANSLKSGWVEKEWRKKLYDEARTKKVQIICIKIDECSIPDFLNDKKYLDMFGSEDIAPVARRIKDSVLEYRERESINDFDELMGSIQNEVLDGESRTKYSISIDEINERILRHVQDETLVDDAVMKALVMAELEALSVEFDHNLRDLRIAASEQIESWETKFHKGNATIGMWLEMSLDRLEAAHLYLLSISRKFDVGFKMLKTREQMVGFSMRVLSKTEKNRSDVASPLTTSNGD